MFIQTRTIVVEKGYSSQAIERFSKPGLLDLQEGLIDKTVMLNKRNKEQEEVVVLIRWESEEAWKNWEKSPEHIQGHRDRRGKAPAEFIISSTVNLYEVKTIRAGDVSATN